MDNMALPQVTTKEQLDQLFAEGYEEMERFGHSDKYNQAVALMSLGADELISTQQLNGALPVSMAQMAGEVAAARASSAQYLQRDRLPAALQDMHIGGQHISEVPVEILHDQAALYMADSQPGPGRDAISQLMAHIDSTPATSFVGIQWEAPEPHLSYEVNSSTGVEANDVYGRVQQQFNPEYGTDALGSLAIRAHRYGTDNLMRGITSLDMSGGGTVETYFDPISQAIGNDGMNQGDASNTFEMD